MTPPAPRTLIRLITCGSVDDGKSTLIGRLLLDCGMVPADQLDRLAADSRRFGTQGPALDPALLVDGLAAEREQGITIDIAWRHLDTPARRIILADCPGHQQFTRNMATGASLADAALLVVDARLGLREQTRRHALICRLMGVPRLVLAITKMDLVGHDQLVFDQICADFAAYAGQIGLSGFDAVPLSGLTGENVARPSPAMAWYGGQPLLALIDTLPVSTRRDASAPLRLPVQWVNRPHAGFRGYAGSIAAGSVRPGDAVTLLPSGLVSTITRIVTAAGDLDVAVAGEAVTLCLADEIAVRRGDVIAAADDAPQVADQFEATLIWMDEAPLKVGRSLWLKLGTQTVSATLRAPKHVLGINTLERLAARTLTLNDIAVIEVATDEPLVFEPYERSTTLGGFVLIDRQTRRTVAAGMIHFALRRSLNVQWQALEVTREARAALLGQRPAVLWFTGLSGAGKSTIANLVEKQLHDLGLHACLLDGDNLRHGLNRDLGFTEADRIENIRRVGEVAKLMTDAGLIVLTALISPFAADRAMVRAMLPEGEFIEIFIDTPLAVVEQRDVKGLYARARAGEIRNFTGIDSPYEPPQAPELHIDTETESAEAAANRIVAFLLAR